MVSYMVCRMQTFRPEDLSHDLWAKIFTHLEGGVKEGLGLKNFDPFRIVESQSRFQQLRLVCHKFNNVFKSHRRLSRRLFISPRILQQSMPSLLHWIGHYGATVGDLWCLL